MRTFEIWFGHFDWLWMAHRQSLAVNVGNLMRMLQARVLLIWYFGKNKRTVISFNPLKIRGRDTLEVQWFRHASKARKGWGFGSHWGTKTILHATWHGQKTKKRKSKNFSMDAALHIYFFTVKVQHSTFPLLWTNRKHLNLFPEKFIQKTPTI